MASYLLQSSRQWHKRIASGLFIFFFLITLTGLLLWWKSLFTKLVFKNSNTIPAITISKWLTSDSLEILAANALNENVHERYAHAETIQLKPSKGYINFLFKNNYMCR